MENELSARGAHKTNGSYTSASACSSDGGGDNFLCAAIIETTVLRVLKDPDVHLKISDGVLSSQKFRDSVCTLSDSSAEKFAMRLIKWMAPFFAVIFSLSLYVFNNVERGVSDLGANITTLSKNITELQIQFAASQERLRNIEGHK